MAQAKGVKEARLLKRERLRSGIALALAERGRAPAARKAELARFFAKEHHLARLLAEAYAEGAGKVCDAFPDGDAPEDVIECHVDVLAFHDEAYAQKFLPSLEHHVAAHKGTKTVARKAFLWFDEDDVFVLAGRRFRVTKVTRERADEITPEEARREGHATVEEWRRAWAESLPRAAPAPSDEGLCFRHEFAAVDET